MRVTLAFALIAAGPCVAASADAAQRPAPADVSMMTYNVHGLPWPLARGRVGAFATMVARLRGLRAEGRQPRILALQEAFTPAAKAIGAAAGYRYVAFGPSADRPPSLQRAAGDRPFEADARHLRGEADGKWVDSGLAIFSDYPIVATRRLAYPICAGYDCLANKGAIAARIAIPGEGPSLYVIDTHLNARTAAGVPHDRADYAYWRQAALLRAFVARTIPRSAPLLVGGDFNVGRSAPRSGAFSMALSARDLGLSSAVARCAVRACATEDGSNLGWSISHRKDWLLYRPGTASTLFPIALSAPFGLLADGRTLSDHVGIAARFQFLASGQRR